MGAQPLPSPYIYLRFGLPNTHEFLTSPWRSPTSLSPHISRCLAKPCWTTMLLHHHHAVVLLLDGVFLNLSLSPCWIKAWERLRKTPSSSSTTAWWWWRSVVLQQGFTKHRKKYEEKER